MVEINKHRGPEVHESPNPKDNLACTVNTPSKIIATAATKALDFLGMSRAAKKYYLLYRTTTCPTTGGYCQSYGFSLLQPPFCFYLGIIPFKGMGLEP